MSLFISYSREDGKAFADALCADLKGRDPWLDREELAPGVDWLKALETAIEQCAVFLPVMTRAYNKARFASLELSRAFRKRKPIIPLRFHADMDISLYLERTQWIDFTEPAQREASVRALLAALDAIERGEAPDAHALPAASPWESIRARAERQTRRGITSALYDPRLYVHRSKAEAELAKFFASDETACILVGDSGAGKSTLLAQWALSLVDAGHVVLTYDCSTLADSDVSDDIARDLGVAIDAYDTLDRDAADAGKNIVLIFDSLGDYRGEERNGAQVLLRRLHTLVTRLPGQNIRVVMSCNTAAWDRIEHASMRFDPARFHVSDKHPFVTLTQFSDAERDEAYTKYREVFDLFSPVEELPDAVRARLSEPVLLRMTAEAYGGVKQPLVAANLGLPIYRRYFEDRVTTNRERWLVGKIAGEMLARKTSALPMMVLAQHEELRAEVLDEDADATYSRLVDRGVLREVRGVAGVDIVVKFSHTRVAAYALATNLLQENVVATVAELVEHAAQFPLGWDTARTLLLLANDANAFLELARSREPEQRALVADTLVELHAQDPGTATTLLQKLLDDKETGARRTALNAAFYIGPAARDLLLRAAAGGDRALRDAVANTLYLIWRNENAEGRQALADALYVIWRLAPGFTHTFLKRLVSEVAFTNLAGVEFIVSLIVKIYINHCEEDEVIRNTDELLRELSIDRLHLNLLRLLGPFQKPLLKILNRSFSEEVLNWMMFADLLPVQPFFRLPEERRAALNRIAEFYDPATNLADAYELLLALLREDAEAPIFGASAAMAIGVHATTNFATTEALVRKLWDETGANEHRWLLHAFAVLFKTTPPEWIPLLEELTARYIDEHREDFLVPPTIVARELDLVLVPLGLAYGKRGQDMPYLERLLCDALAQDDLAFAARIIEALNAVGFYHPIAVFRLLAPAFAKLDDERIAAALEKTLATIRTLHFDAVDRFLGSVHAPEAFRRRIDVAADVAAARRFIKVLGFYNNGVHLSSKYPRMRRTFSAGALRILAASKNPVQFTVDYTAAALRLALETGFQPMQWILPE
jgi:GTPase SAR1 family protein